MQKMLTGATLPDARDTTIRALEDRVRELERELEDERARQNGVVTGVHELRQILTPLHNALRMVFGEFEDMGAYPGTSAPGVDPHKAAIWAEWKNKLPGHPAKFIDALLIHGALTQTQLRIHARCAAGTVPGVVSKLWKAGLINKRDGKISLKEL